MNHELKLEDYIKLKNLIYDKAGLFFATNKIYFVKKRLEKRMISLGMNDFQAYYDSLKYYDRTGEELQNLINELTTNETYFFRETAQLEVFADHCLAEVMAAGNHREKSLRIWSAGCSSGEEPYTLAIILQEKMRLHPDWRFSIMATDIDTGILKKAEEGLYNDRSIKNVKPELLKRYFNFTPEGYRISQNLKNTVNFSHLNLNDGAKMKTVRGIDFLFCRNVLIYFDELSRKIAMAHFYDSLNRGGFIFLGHSESVTRINSAFSLKRLGGMIVYQKP